MHHNFIKTDSSGDHWAVGLNTFFLPGQQAQVLVQLQERGVQVRLALSVEQAEAMAGALLAQADKARQTAPYRP